jgi:pimeloyl-ACP methyl ester carboxylesterase
MVHNGSDIAEYDYTGLYLAAFVALLFCFPQTAQADASNLSWEPYVLDTGKEKIRAELGHLNVPERHSDPNGKQIQLAFVRIKSTSKHPGPPIVYLAGGPGGSGIRLAQSPRSPVILAMRAFGDVIALDQRGTGLSRPLLICPETLDYPLNRPGTREALLLQYEKKLSACVKRLQANGVELMAYNTLENADDLESLRRGLGVPKISLFGSSYGSHLGLVTLRRHGDRIHRAIFCGVEGLDHTLKSPRAIQQQLSLVGQLAHSDDRIRSHVPNLLQLVADVLEQLERQPVEIVVDNFDSVTRVTIGKFDLQQVTAGLLGTREGKTSIPALYYHLSIGKYDSPIVQAMARQIVDQRTGPVGSAMGVAMDCTSGASVTRRRLIQQQASESLLGSDIDFPIPDVCAACGLQELPDSFRASFRCDVPTLFVSGSLDGRTPPTNAEEVRQGFSDSRSLVIAGAGHGHELFISSPEIKEAMLEFMTSGTVSTKTIQLPPIQFKELDSKEATRTKR